MVDDTLNQAGQIVHKPPAPILPSQTSHTATTARQQPLTRDGYPWMPRAQHLALSEMDTPPPTDRQGLQAAAADIGGHRSFFSHSISSSNPRNRLESSRLVNDKVAREEEEERLLSHSLTEHAPNSLINDVRMTSNFGNYASSATISGFDSPILVPVLGSNTNKISKQESTRLGMLGEEYGIPTTPTVSGVAPFQIRRQSSQQANYMNGSNYFNAVGLGMNVEDEDRNNVNVSRVITNIDQGLLSLNRDMLRSHAEPRQETANAVVHGNGRLRLPLPASERFVSNSRAFHSTPRGSGKPLVPNRTFDPVTSQRIATENRGPQNLQHVGSSSVSGAASSSPAAQAGLRRKNNTRYSGTSSPVVPVSRASSPSLPKYSVPSSTVRVPYDLPFFSSSEVLSPYGSDSQRLALPHAPLVGNGISLIKPKERIPERFHTVFPYDSFNAVQSRCFNPVYMTNNNVIVSAPTGSGKTVLLDMAICKLVSEKGNENAKIVYIAPTKALCKEKAEEWRKKFCMMTMPVSELTGDTSRAEMRTVREAMIIVTTPEKWDSITRSWIDHRKLLDLVELFLIDEVHILKETRGATLEAVVSRMKTYGAKVRFIALSATIPNSADVAAWLGKDHANPELPAEREVFGEEFRPVKLQKVVHGIEAKLADHPFDNYLNSQLWKYIEMHTQRKPILVFCMTRKSCRNAAEELAKQWSQRQPSARLWPQPSKRIPVIDTSLQELVRYGVAFHHAGLESDDRKAIHQAFEEGHLSVICCTSTLAVGVNLPCHTVVLKGTISYQDGGKLCEYSDLEVMQMLGRAGRPQYEDSALAIILTRPCNKKRYEELGSGHQILESTLHKNLIEHLNSELSLGTFQDTSGAKLWLKGTFLSVRLHRNPQHYGDLTDGRSIPSTRNSGEMEHHLEEICEAAIDRLRDACLIQGDTTFQHTDYGRAMSRYMISFETMKLILKIPRGASKQVLLSALSEAREFSEIRWQASERDMFRDINRDPFIMYPIESTVGTVAHKVSLLIQMELGRVELTNINGFERQRLRGEASRVLDTMKRLIRTVIECKGSDADGPACWAALELARSITAKAWEDRPMQLLQVPQLGPVLMRKLVSHNIRTVSQLADADPGNIERIASRNPPFGKKMVDSLAFFPRLTLATAIQESKLDHNGNAVIHIDALLGFLNARGKWSGKVPIVTFLAITTGGDSVHFCRESLKTFDQDCNTQQIHFNWTPDSVEETLTCQFSCEEIVGTVVVTKIRHNLSASSFPPRTKNDRLVSGEPQRPMLPQIASASSPVEIEVDDNDILEILDDSSRKRASDKRDEYEADIDDDDLLTMLDANGDFQQKQPKSSSYSRNQGQEACNDKGYQEEVKSVASARTRQPSTGVNARQPVVARKSRNPESQPLVHDERTIDIKPTRLANGRYKCGHPCSQVGGGTTARGDKCGHDCCRNGSKHPPKKHNNNEKRKERSGSVAISGYEPVPDFSVSDPPPKRVRLNDVTKSKANPPCPTPILSPAQSRRPQKRPVLDINLCNVDEEGIVDLTNDYDSVSDAPPRARAASTLKLGNIGNKRSEIKEATENDDMLDDLSDDCFIDVAMTNASTTTRGGKCDSVLNYNNNNNSIGPFNETTSLMLLKEAEDEAGFKTLGGHERMGNRKLRQDTGRDCDSMVRPRMAADYMFGDITPLEIANDERLSNEADEHGEQAGFSPRGAPRVDRPKTPGINGPASSTNIPDAAAVSPQWGRSVVDESLEKRSKGGSEPEWVNDFDPAFISEFRGFVDFI